MFELDGLSVPPLHLDLDEAIKKEAGQDAKAGALRKSASEKALDDFLQVNVRIRRPVCVLATDPQLR